MLTVTSKNDLEENADASAITNLINTVLQRKNTDESWINRLKSVQSRLSRIGCDEFVEFRGGDVCLMPDAVAMAIAVYLEERAQRLLELA